MRYDFEWDLRKAVLNLRKHKVSFDRATNIFRDSNAISIPDEEHSDTRSSAINRIIIMKKEYDFSKGDRGKFHHSDAQFNLPIYLQPEIAEFIDRLAREKKMDASHVVNSLLKKDMELNEHGQ